MNTEKYFRKLGYDLAMGYDSIKLLRIMPEQIPYFQRMTKQEIRNDIDSIRETAQWEYQVIYEIEKFLIPSKLDLHAYLIEFNQLEKYVIEGYCDAIDKLTGDDDE